MFIRTKAEEYVRFESVDSMAFYGPSGLSLDSVKFAGNLGTPTLRLTVGSKTYDVTDSAEIAKAIWELKFGPGSVSDSDSGS